MIVIEVDGVQYGNFTAANVSLRLDALSNTFGFEATSEDARPLPFKGGEGCLIFVSGEQVLSGSIEVVNASYSSSDHTISIQGRDKLGDLLDSSLSALSDIKAKTLKALCERVLKEVGVDVLVIDEVNPDPFNPAQDIAAPDPAENAFAFLEKYARQRQVLLTGDFDANLVLARSSGIETGGLIQNRKDNRGEANNVISGDVSYDSTGRFNLYRAVSQLNPTAASLTSGFGAREIASQGVAKDVLDDEIRKGRQLILISEAMTETKVGVDRATWELNIRKARGRAYSVELAGFVDQEENLWAINTLPRIDDDDADIQDRMLINSVDFSNSAREGEKTVLSMVEANAYSLSLEDPTISATKQKSGSGIGSVPGF